jgi:hypothetical protein
MAIRGCGLFLAFGLSLASLAGILLVLFGGLDKGSKVFDNLFAMQIDLTTFFANEPDGSSRGMIAGVTNMTAGSIPGMNADNQAFSQALWQERRLGQLKQFYSVFLWDWCSSDAAVVDSNAFCSAETFAFTFDPFKAMNLTRSIGSQTEESAYPEALRVAMQAYDKSSTWLRISYIIAGVAKLVELIFGLVAVTSKWGSLCAAFTALVSSFFFLCVCVCEHLPMERRLSTYESSKKQATSVFLFVVTISHTAIWAVLVAGWNKSLDSIGVHTYLGKGYFVVIWLSVVLSFGGSLWWLLTMCCANRRDGPSRAGRSRTWIPNAQAIRGQRYENVEAANLGPRLGGIPMAERATPAAESLLRSEGHYRSTSDTGYEAYRHQDIGA